MVDVYEKVLYKAFGLIVASQISLSELSVVRNLKEQIDIEIEVSNLEDMWEELVPATQKYYVGENLILFRILHTAIFCIKDGTKIIVSPMKAADESKIRLFILGTCMGALLIQRKVIPLHGSAIEIDGKAYAIIGESGAGKSTLASALIKRGYKLLSDDVIPVSFSEDNIPIVTPSYPQQKLWETSLIEFGMCKDLYEPIIERENKFVVPVQSHFSKKPLPLAGIFELDKTENKHIELRELKGIERFGILFSHTYRNFLIELLNEMEWHFSSSSKIVKQTNIFQLRRPVSVFTADRLASIIIETIKKENVTC